MRTTLIALGMALLVMTGAVAADNKQEPDEFVKKAAQEVLDALQGQREEIKKDPARAQAVVEEVLLPKFDFDYSARLVLGRHGKDASPEQRERFRDAFYGFLARSYADGLADFKEGVVEVKGYKGNDKRVVVRTVVKTGEGKSIPVDYRLHRTEEGWRAYDVIIEGVSYVQNYRKQFGNEIQQTSLDALIERLEKESA